MAALKKFLDTYVLYLAWLVSFLATFGSLYYSEVAHFLPCLLCWYQRICMYPILVLLTVGIIRKDKVHLPYYILPLSIIGALIAFYQNLLVWGVVNEAVAPCTAGVSCTTKYVNYLGFITIPLLSLAAFVIITISLIYFMRRNKPSKK